MNSKRLVVRIPEHLETMLAGAADRHGRGVAAETRTALELHCHRALQLDCRERSPALLATLDGDEDAFTAFAAQVEQDTAALEVLAYRKPSIVDIRRGSAAMN